MQYFISTSIECTTAEGVCEEEFWQKQNKVSQETEYEVYTVHAVEKLQEPKNKSVTTLNSLMDL